MEQRLSDYDKRMFERAEKDKKGITTVGNLFCEDQLVYSERGRVNYDKIDWKQGGCQQAMCRLWRTEECPEGSDPDFDFKRCVEVQ